MSRATPLRSQFDASADPSHAAFIHGEKRRAQDEVAPTNASAQTGSPIQLPINRIIKHGRFDWGSFSAFEDGSIEVEIARREAVVSKLFRVGEWSKIQRTEMMG